MSKHSELFYKKLDDYYSDRNKKKPWNITELTEVAAEILRAKQNSGKKTRRQYHLLSLYDVLEVAEEKIVIKKDKHDGGKYVSKNSSYHKVIERSPYKALFGVDPKAGFSPMNLPRDLLDEVENEDNLRMLEEEHMENNNLQKELQSDVVIGDLNNMILMEEMEEQHGMGEVVDGHKDVVEGVIDSIAENQEEIETVVFTNENTEKMSTQEINLCITCPKGG
ncbi:unnamed protein product, partial [Callosobruchus maculatus]